MTLSTAMSFILLVIVPFKNVLMALKCARFTRAHTHTHTQRERERERESLGRERNTVIIHCTLIFFYTEV